MTYCAGYAEGVKDRSPGPAYVRAANVRAALGRGRPKASAERVTWRRIASCRGRNQHGLPVDLPSGSCKPTALGETLTICRLHARMRPLDHPRSNRCCEELNAMPWPIAVSASAPRTSRPHARPPHFGVDYPGRRDRSKTRGHLPWALVFNAFSVCEGNDSRQLKAWRTVWRELTHELARET